MEQNKDPGNLEGCTLEFEFIFQGYSNTWFWYTAILQLANIVLYPKFLTVGKSQ